MRHWIQSVKERWKTTSPKEEENDSEYKPSENFMERVRERQAAEKKRKEKWQKELKQKMNSNNYNPIFNSTQSYNPNTAGQWVHTTNNPTLKVDGIIEVNGRDVMKELDEMRDALLLLKRDVDMEEKYPKLKELKDAYEAQLEKYKTFEALK